MATWNDLPKEMRQMVLEALVELYKDSRPGAKKLAKTYLAKTRKPLSSHASVCKEWQAIIEPTIFQSITIRTRHLADFENFVRGERRRYLRRLWFRVELIKPLPEPVHEDDKAVYEEDNNMWFTTAVHDLFRILNRWGGRNSEPYLELELGALASTDRKYVSGGIDPGIKNDSEYAVGELEFCFVDANKKFSYPAPLPEAHVVASFSVLRRTRRYFAPTALLTMFDSLPQLREVRFEPWFFLNTESQADVDEAFGRYIRHWPSTIRRISIFEHCNDFRRHFPAEFTGLTEDWEDELFDDAHGHHHYHHPPHYHGHAYDQTEDAGGGQWVTDNGSSGADEEGWETADEDASDGSDDEEDTEDAMDMDEDDGHDHDAAGAHTSTDPFPSPPVSILSSSIFPNLPNIPMLLFGAPSNIPFVPLPSIMLASSASTPHDHPAPGPSGDSEHEPSSTGSGNSNNNSLANPSPTNPSPANPMAVPPNSQSPMDIPLPHLGLGVLFSRPSQQLEELAVSGLIDARDFFDPFYAKPEAGQSLPQWDRLKWLTLSSPTLIQTLEDGGEAANELLQAAGRAAMRMPKLEVMELYCTDDRRGGAVFRYRVTDTSTAITFQSVAAPPKEPEEADPSATAAAEVNAIANSLGDALMGGQDDPAPVAHDDPPGPDEDFRVSIRVKETWQRVARKHTRNDLDPIFEEVLPAFESPFKFIHDNLVTRELVLSEISSKDILGRNSVPPAKMKLPNKLPLPPPPTASSRAR